MKSGKITREELLIELFNCFSSNFYNPYTRIYTEPYDFDEGSWITYPLWKNQPKISWGHSGPPSCFLDEEGAPILSPMIPEEDLTEEYYFKLGANQLYPFKVLSKVLGFFASNYALEVVSRPQNRKLPLYFHNAFILPPLKGRQGL